MPSFYLKRWGDDGNLRVTEIDKRRPWVATPRRAAAETGDPRAGRKMRADFIESAISDPDALLRDDEERVFFSIWLTR